MIPNLVAYNLKHSLCDQHFRSNLAAESNFTVFRDIAVKMLAKAAVIRMLDWVWKIYFYHIPIHMMGKLVL